MSGSTSYHAGLSAEDQVARHYASRGLSVAAHRWRGKGGEIDLITRDGDMIVFVEVKKSRSHARAAERLSQRQMQRLYDAAGEFLAGCPQGLATPARFDVALVDGVGRVHILENALCA
jgi:putative endonuclease